MDDAELATVQERLSDRHDDGRDREDAVGGRIDRLDRVAADFFEGREIGDRSGRGLRTRSARSLRRGRGNVHRLRGVGRRPAGSQEPRSR